MKKLIGWVFIIVPIVMVIYYVNPPAEYYVFLGSIVTICCGVILISD